MLYYCIVVWYRFYMVFAHISVDCVIGRTEYVELCFGVGIGAGGL